MIFTSELYDLYIPPYLLIGIAALVTFLLTFSAIPGIVKISREKSLMAHPNGRTSHQIPTPNLGGIAIFAGVIISSVVFTGVSTAHELKYIIAGTLILFFVGLKDDLLPLPAYQKFIGQSLATLIILVPGDLYLHSLQGLFGIYEMPHVAGIVITFILFLALINSFNLIDGIDGLASGIGILTSLFFGIVFLLNGPLVYAIMSFILCSSLLAFFYFNVFSKKNKIFLGDSGSMLIGLLVSILAIKFLNMEKSTLLFHQNNSSAAVLLAVLIIPVFDTARVFVVRISQGKSPFEADRIHIHHHMLLLSGSHLAATLKILSSNVLFLSMPFLFRNLSGEELTLLILALATALFNIPVYINKMRNKYSFNVKFQWKLNEVK
jgi:UDP-N-acetylmuramyl pentapeptide phosphotransferase/UDP-N-acetylglucosamine-1-phosphate transferase